MAYFHEAVAGGKRRYQGWIKTPSGVLKPFRARLKDTFIPGRNNAYSDTYAGIGDDVTETGFVYGVTQPGESNTGAPPLTSLVLMTKANGAALGSWSTNSIGVEIFTAKAGANIVGWDIPWPVLINQPNVIIKNNRISGPNGIAGAASTVKSQNPELGLITVANSLGLLTKANRPQIIQCDVIAAVPYSGSTGIIGGPYLADRCKVKDVTDYFGVYQNFGDKTRADVEIIGCYGTDIAFFDKDPYQSNGITHNDGIQWQGGKGLRVFGNYLEMAWSVRADTPAGVSQKNASGRWYCDNYPGGGRVMLAGANVSPLGEADVQQNWWDGGITGPFAHYRAGQGASGQSLGVFKGNRDLGHHQILTLGGVREQIGTCVSPGLSWTPAWSATLAEGARFEDTTEGNVLQLASGATSRSIIRSKAS